MLEKCHAQSSTQNFGRGRTETFRRFYVEYPRVFLLRLANHLTDPIVDFLERTPAHALFLE
jgi:hypothetical protein